LQKSVAKWVAKTAFGGRFIDRRKHGGTLLQKSINSLGCVVAISRHGNASEPLDGQGTAGRFTAKWTVLAQTCGWRVFPALLGMGKAALTEMSFRKTVVSGAM
jgi:hypothetical protein